MNKKIQTPILTNVTILRIIKEFFLKIRQIKRISRQEKKKESSEKWECQHHRQDC